MELSELFKLDNDNNFFILDSHQSAMEEMNFSHSDLDYASYSYNIHKNNTLTPNSVFLYRRPGHSTSDGKFIIYGGGMISSITKPDINGNVSALIEHGFMLNDPIKQGSQFIENFAWETRSKPGPGWKGFWTNYGINKIKKSDFYRLLKGRSFTLVETLSVEVEDDEANPYTFNETASDFSLTKRDSVDTAHENKTYRFQIKKTDFISTELYKQTIGSMGELLVMKFETERLKSLGENFHPIHVSKEFGDGYGYDILSYDGSGDEIYIEVKTTCKNTSGDFYMSRNEVNKSKRYGEKYKIYRIFNLNRESNTADLIIYNGPITSDQFSLECISYKVNKV